MILHKNILTSFLLCSTLLFLAGCGKKEEKKIVVKEEKTLSVNVHTLKKQTYPIWVDFSGKTQAFKDVTIVPRIKGELKKKFFKAGDMVKKGDVLFKIDDTEYKAILAQKSATLKKDEANLKLALANVKRYTPLVKKDLAPREKLDELIASQEQLEATISSDKSTIKQAQINVDYTQVRATISGQIGKSLINTGNIVDQSSSLAKIVQSKQLYVNFNPSSNEVSLLKKYKSEEFPTIKVTPQNNENNTLQLSGKIDFIDNVTNQATGTVAMRAIINNQENLLFPGTFVEIKLFVTDQLSVIAVHPNNLSQNQLGSYVLVVDENKKVQTRQIEISYSNTDLVIIKSGLKADDKIIVSALKQLKNNQKVNTVEVNNPIKL